MFTAVGRVPFLAYAAAWIDERPGLRPKTVQLYRYLLRSHLRDAFGSATVAGITEPEVRRWRADMLSAGVTPVTAARAYRLLKSIMATAVDDGLIRRNPCRIKGASVEKSPERPLLTVSQVYALADAVERRYRALILLACFCGLRWGELAGLQRADIDCDHRTVRVGRQLTADAGANLRELMERMGHSSSCAALIYLHSTSDRQRQLAETVADRVQSELGMPDRTETNRVARVWHDSESTDGETP